MTGGSRIAQPVVVGQSDLDDADSAIDVERWQELARRALETEGISSGELSLLFIDTEAMAALNAEHMGVSGPTDVLAFPIDGEGHSSDPVVPRLLGDVVICPAVARVNAAARGCALGDELALLVVHGVLHVLGHDHAEPEETARMQERERALLDAHHRP